MIAELVEWHEVWVREVHHRSKLVLEQQQSLRCDLAIPKRLEGDATAVLRVHSIVDVAHASFVDQCVDLVAADPHCSFKDRVFELGWLHRVTDEMSTYPDRVAPGTCDMEGMPTCTSELLTASKRSASLPMDGSTQRSAGVWADHQHKATHTVML